MQSYNTIINIPNFNSLRVNPKANSELFNTLKLSINKTFN